MRKCQVNKRKKYLIQKVFQTKVIFFVLLLIVLSSIISGIILYKRTNIDLGFHYGEAHSKLKNTGEILLPNVLVGNIIAIIFIGAASIVFTILLSHKIAGPLHRFEKNAEQIARGDLTIVTKLRQNDQIHGLAESFSKMTIELREKLLGIKKGSDELPGLLKKIQRLSRQEHVSSKDLSGISQQLSQINETLQNSLNNFKL